MLDLGHDALAGLVGIGELLGDDAIEAGAFEALEPVERDFAVAGGGREVGGGSHALEVAFETGAAFAERGLLEVVRPVAEHVEGDEGGGRFAGEHADARFGGVDAHLEGFEVEATGAHDDDFAVEDGRAGEGGSEALDEFGEIARQWLEVTRLEVGWAGAIEENDASEAIPLGLEEPAITCGDFRGELGEHGGEGGRSLRAGHAGIVA